MLTESISFPNSKKGCGKFFKIFEKFEIAPENVVIGMEATGHYWLFVYSFFIKINLIIKVINAIHSEAFIKMYIHQTKNDSRDSFIISQIIWFGQYSETKLSEENIESLYVSFHGIGLL